MPGVGIHGFTGKALQMAQAGVYDLRIHHDEILWPLLRYWNLFGLEGLQSEAEQARERLAAHLAKGLRQLGVMDGVELPGEELFFSNVHLHGGPSPVRRFLPELVDLIWDRKIDPGKVFDLSLPLEEVAEGYRAMDERRAIKTLLRP